MALRIRVRCPTVSPTPIQLEGCTSQTTYRGFQSIILKALGLEEPAEGDAGLSILAGFPPRYVGKNDDALRVLSLVTLLPYAMIIPVLMSYSAAAGSLTRVAKSTCCG